MKDLFTKFQENRSTGNGKTKYGIIECLAIMLLKSDGKNVKQISKIINRSENGLQYVLSNRVLGEVKNYKDLCEKMKVDYKQEQYDADVVQAKKIIG